MASLPHRFLQYLWSEQDGGHQWVEQAALDGGTSAPARPVPHVEVVPGGLVSQGIRHGLRLVLKGLVRLLYLAPLLLLLKVVLALAVGPHESDYVTVGFVMLVVAFFVVVNLYLVWAVVCYVASRRRPGVVPPALAGRARIEAAMRDPAGAGRPAGPGGEVVTVTGVLVPLDSAQARGTRLVADLWAPRGREPWRVTEAFDLAVLPEDERAVVVQVRSAPALVHAPRAVVVGEALEAFGPGLEQAFSSFGHIGQHDLQRRGHWLELHAGDRVQVSGLASGEIPNVERFELEGKVCSARAPEAGAQTPYRGHAGRPGVLLVASEQTPVVLRKLDR